MTNPGAPGIVLGEGENLEIDPPRKLVQTMVALWGEDVKSEGTSRVTWEIEPVGDSSDSWSPRQLRGCANSQPTEAGDVLRMKTCWSGVVLLLRARGQGHSELT